MRVAAFTSGAMVPSTRFRVRQYMPALSARGITVREYPCVPNKYAGRPVVLPEAIWHGVQAASRLPGLLGARTADVVWLEREFVWRHRTLERFAGDPRRRIFDVDDAIWLGGVGDFAERIASECAGVIAGNSYIAEHFRPHAKQVWIVPTSVDPARWAPTTAARTPGDRFVVGWTGTSGNFPYLQAIEPGLATFLQAHPDAEFLVIADRAPTWTQLPVTQTRFVRWTEAGEVAAVQQMDVGLMPLADEPWARGKCAAKMLVYMAAGIPVVVSPVGVNADILAMDSVGFAAVTAQDWADKLTWLHDNRDRATEMGRRGQTVVDREYSVAVNAARLANIFAAVAGG